MYVPTTQFTISYEIWRQSSTHPRHWHVMQIILQLHVFIIYLEPLWLLCHYVLVKSMSYQISVKIQQSNMTRSHTLFNEICLHAVQNVTTETAQLLPNCSHLLQITLCSQLIVRR
jgi:hypothetical protein